MNERVFMQPESEAGLRARFQSAAAREQRHAADVLRQLMREYVDRHSGADAVGTDPNPGSVTRAAGQVALESYADPTQPACWPNGDQDLEALVRRQHGWRCSPFGAE